MIGTKFEHLEAFPVATGVRKVFCERLTPSDRMLARPPSTRPPIRASWRSYLGERPLAWILDRPAIPDSLIYDSTPFVGVDECQRADALEPAASASQAHRGQCICSLNNEEDPNSEFSLNLHVEETNRMRLEYR